MLLEDRYLSMLLEKLGKNSKGVLRSVMQDTQGNTGIHSDTQRLRVIWRRSDLIVVV